MCVYKDEKEHTSSDGECFGDSDDRCRSDCTARDAENTVVESRSRDERVVLPLRLTRLVVDDGDCVPFLVVITPVVDAR